MKIKMVYIICIICILLTGCGGKPVVEIDEIPEETGLFNTLSEEQQNYLIEELRFTQDWIDTMSYEVINFQLLGSGYELYNASSGVEIKGIYYSYGPDVPKEAYGNYYGTIKSTDDKKITLEEAVEIRKKGKELTLEDFLKYSFEIEEGMTGTNLFRFPIEGYDDCFIEIKVAEAKDGSVHMLAPWIGHKTQCFSLLLDVELFKEYALTTPNYSYEDKVIAVMQANSLTPKSMVIRLNNYSDNKITVDASFKLYKYENDKYIELTDYAYETKEVWEARELTASIVPISFATDETALTPGKYKIIVGKDERNSLYKEIEFTID